ncbi:ABC transporter substrate-binding protein [Salipaludibacillus sp. HK11]|uniref:ABC transporter substrate-binding protein n=1 Tax=Salipaludibacillus sp. HK11 TaxID=3394320 RepID=UPI0039FC754D
MKQKTALLGFILFLSSSLIIACSNDNSETTNNENESNGSGNASEEEITLSFVHWINEETGNWEELIEMYEEENEGVKIESTPLVENMSTEDYYQQLDLLASSGESLDIIMFSTLPELVTRVNAGLVSPIDDLLDNEGIDINSDYNHTYSEIDGNYYAIPMKSVSNLVVLNKDHLDEVGLEVPTEWTWDDYREYANQLTTDNRYGSFLSNFHSLHSTLKMFGKSDNPYLLKEDGSSNADDPFLRESLELRYQMEIEDNSSVPYSETISQQLDFRQQFFSESVSMVPIGSFLITEWGQFTPEFEIAWAPWPKNSEESVNYTEIGGDALTIAQTSEYKEEAYDFMRWLSTEGIQEQGISIPAWTESDLDTVLENLLENTSNPDAVNIDSVINALTIIEPQERFAPPAHNREADSEFESQVELLLLGEQDLDTTMEEIKERIEAIVEANQ